MYSSQKNEYSSQNTIPYAPHQIHIKGRMGVLYFPFTFPISIIWYSNKNRNYCGCNRKNAMKFGGFKKNVVTLQYESASFLYFPSKITFRCF